VTKKSPKKGRKNSLGKNSGDDPLTPGEAPGKVDSNTNENNVTASGAREEAAASNQDMKDVDSSFAVPSEPFDADAPTATPDEPVIRKPMGTQAHVAALQAALGKSSFSSSDVDAARRAVREAGRKATLRAEQAAETAKLAIEAMVKVNKTSADVSAELAAMREKALAEAAANGRRLSFMSSSELYSKKLDDALKNCKPAAERAEASKAPPAPPPMFRFEQSEKDKLPTPQTGLGRVLRKTRHDQDIDNVNCENVPEYEHPISLKETIAQHRADHELALSRRPRADVGVTVYNYVVGSPKLFHSVRHPYTDEELFGEGPLPGEPGSKDAGEPGTSPTKSKRKSSQHAGAGESFSSRLHPNSSKKNQFDAPPLHFESRFESGNLMRAIQISNYEYDLYLQNDVNTRGNTQWFYFAVEDFIPGVEYTFRVCNMYKKDSLYNQGMRPIGYSCRAVREAKIAAVDGTVPTGEGLGWHRCGSKVCYYATTEDRPAGNGKFYAVAWSITFSHTRDTFYFAHSHPYTFTNLQRDLWALEQDPERATTFRRKALCYTLAGNRVDLITITSPVQRPHEMAGRRKVVMSARVHPGEVVASWMMRGCLNFITGPSEEAQLLRKRYIFMLVPMMNPDGVINGNYRTSLIGKDLNRQWLRPSENTMPSVYSLKKLLQRLGSEREASLDMFCDLHGHSRKKNVFFYGCSPKVRIGSKDEQIKARLHERLLPYLLSQDNPVFDFDSCTFHVSKSKRSTGRVVAWAECQVPNSYTMEASFFGGDLTGETMHFTPASLEGVGDSLCRSVLSTGQVRASLENMSELPPSSSAPYPKDWGNAESDKIAKDILWDISVVCGTIEDDAETSDSEGSLGSDSEPSAGNMSEPDITVEVAPKPKGDEDDESKTDTPRSTRRKARLLKEGKKSARKKGEDGDSVINNSTLSDKDGKDKDDAGKGREFKEVPKRSDPRQERKVPENYGTAGFASPEGDPAAAAAASMQALEYLAGSASVEDAMAWQKVYCPANQGQRERRGRGSSVLDSSHGMGGSGERTDRGSHLHRYELHRGERHRGDMDSHGRRRGEGGGKGERHVSPTGGRSSGHQQRRAFAGAPVSGGGLLSTASNMAATAPYGNGGNGVREGSFAWNDLETEISQMRADNYNRQMETRNRHMDISHSGRHGDSMGSVQLAAAASVGNTRAYRSLGGRDMFPDTSQNRGMDR